MKKCRLKWDSNRELTFAAYLEVSGLNPCKETEFFHVKKLLIFPAVYSNHFSLRVAFGPDTLKKLG